MLSFVVPAHNEETLLPRTLPMLNASAREVGEPFEVVVTDDASTDRTAEIAREHGARVVRIDRRQIAASRNAGGRAARGDLLIFVDADTFVPPGPIRGAVDAVAAGATSGGAGVDFDGEIPAWSRLLFARGGRVIYRMLRLASGAFLFCTREAFDAVGGFDETLYAGEEVFMSRALRRHGRFVVLRENVITSGRKLRTYTGRELFAVLARLAIKGRRGVRSRDGLDMWYGERRPDPESLD